MVFWCGSPVGSSMRLEYTWSDRSQKDRFSSDPSDDSASPDHRIHASEEKDMRVRVFPTEHAVTSG